MDMCTSLELKGAPKQYSIPKCILLEALAVKRNMRVWMGTETGWILGSTSVLYHSAAIRLNSQCWFSLVIFGSAWPLGSNELLFDRILITNSNNERQITAPLLERALLLLVDNEQLRSNIFQIEERERSSQLCASAATGHMYKCCIFLLCSRNS